MMVCVSGFAQKGNSTPQKGTGYNFAGHSNFKTFWADFKKAVNAGDKEAVAKMTYFPFKDSRDLGQGIGTGPNNLTCNNPKDLINKYNKIFLPATIKAISKNSYHQCVDYDGDPDNKNQKKIPDCYEFLDKDASVWLDFSKVNGVFKMTNIPYKE